MENRGLLTSNLPPTTLKKLAWYLRVPTGESIDEFFDKLPVNDESDVITRFSKYTRMLAGDDPEALPDETTEEKRIKNAYSPSNDADKTFKQSLKRPKVLQHPIVEEGRKVAAKLDDEQGWILMTVIKYSKRAKIYTLEDADDQAEKKEEHEVPRDMVLPLPSPEYTPPTFVVGTRVLALYPGTTSFYPAIVVKQIRRAVAASKQNGKPSYDYSLRFDDDVEDEEGEVVVRKIKGDFIVEDVGS